MKSIQEIPRIDLSPLFQKTNTGIFEVAEQMREVFTQVGFAYIYHHGFSEELLEAAFNASRQFHALSFEEKIKIKQNKFYRGYLAIGESILKISTLGDAKKPNQSEAFILAHEVEEHDPDFIAGINLAGPNQWPACLPEFKKIITDYNHEMLFLVRKLVQVFAVAFGLEQNALDKYFINPTTFLRLQYYPEQPNFIPENQFGIAPHTDYGFLTILAQDDCGGLQVRSLDGKWIDVPPVPGMFILNSGDMLKRLSNDIYLSTPHRVINRSGKKRYSIPFIFEPNMHALIEPLPNFCDSNNPSKHAPLEYCDYLMKRVRKNYQINA